MASTSSSRTHKNLSLADRVQVLNRLDNKEMQASFAKHSYIPVFLNFEVERTIAAKLAE